MALFAISITLEGRSVELCPCFDLLLKDGLLFVRYWAYDPKCSKEAAYKLDECKKIDICPIGFGG